MYLAATGLDGFFEQSKVKALTQVQLKIKIGSVGEWFKPPDCKSGAEKQR